VINLQHKQNLYNHDKASMKKFIAFLLATSVATGALVAENQYSVYVDNAGVMRRDDTRQEVSFYGTNYTVPFAHSYRALGYLGIDRKEAIRRDVYHMARLGFNAFRLHLWDVELTDSLGNLQTNEHLDLLDFLINELESRGISIVITAQTNFGNGYPEKNVDTGAYSYDYDKCDIHANKSAQEKQARYLRQLVKHVNGYTNRSYADDRSIIAIEINNEPCHKAPAKDVTAYINKMVKSLRSAKWQKPILYNVSHNREVVDAYYKADIQGTTYQWYPIGLVAGHERKGNFLPFVDQYDIPFSDVKGFDSKAKVVYEFDPADILYSYMYPAITRTFRKEGFQWITQFAYDPIDMAWANTEYQTHYLNLAYTPSKAISMKIAGEVARTIERGSDFGKYPADTIFSDFRVSYKQDLSEYNCGAKFFYSNTTATRPSAPDELREIAGVGSSAVVSYDGTGAYFLDRIDDSTWRLEVMPDVLFSKDPFSRPSLSRRVADILYAEHPMTITLPQLGKTFSYRAVNAGNDRKGQASAGCFEAYPGVYLLSADSNALAEVDTDSVLGNIRISEYVAPERRDVDLTVVHTPVAAVEADSDLTISATVYGSVEPDSVVVYPSEISFWNDHNVLYKMHKVGPYKYETKIKVNNRKKDCFYNIVAFADGMSSTYPGAISGSPLDWDYVGKDYYHTEVYQSGAPIVLFEPVENNGSEFSTIPEAWGGSFYGYEKHCPFGDDCMHLHAHPTESKTDVIVYKRVAEMLACHKNLSHERKLALRLGEVSGTDSVTISVVNSDGMTFSVTRPATSGIIEVSLDELSLTATPLAPAPYPVFLSRQFTPDPGYNVKPRWDDVEQVIIGFPGIAPDTDLDIQIMTIWIK
jgi:hypothetical protein